VATAAATLAWCIVEQLRHGRPSLLGAVTGAVVGLVAITPASGFAAPMAAIVLGLVASPICYIFVSSVKKTFGYDDSLDVFGVHAVGGIVGAIGTGIVADPALGGQGWYDYTVFPAVAGAYELGAQVWVQIQAVVVTVLWTAIVSAVLFLAIKAVFGLRPSSDEERQGLDQTSHGESAYNY
jgi:Amt family ammonium transporter